jgi:hypothetical protein
MKPASLTIFQLSFAESPLIIASKTGSEASIKSNIVTDECPID